MIQAAIGFILIAGLCFSNHGHREQDAEQPPTAAANQEPTETFARDIQPLLSKWCGQCHGAEPTHNELDLSRFTSTQAFLAQPKVLENLADRLRLADMPPREAPQPSDAQRDRLLAWSTAALDAEAAARAGDPGPVSLRRLSNAAYDNAIRDLTGIDMRPTLAREFPLDSVGGEGFANVGDAMPATPELIERYHQTARDVAARAVLLPTGFRFSTSTERPDWTAETLRPLRDFHDRYAGPQGEPPLATHLAATLRHRDRLARDGRPAIAEIAAAEQLNATYLAALWDGLHGPELTSPEVAEKMQQWRQEVAQRDIELQRRQAIRQAAGQAVDAAWMNSKRVLATARVAEGEAVSFDQQVTVQPGELLLLTVLPNENHGADSTRVEWTIREVGGGGRTWNVVDVVPQLLRGNPQPAAHDATWSFLETTSAPEFLTQQRTSHEGQPALQAWSLGPEPSVFVNSADEPLQVWTRLPARSFFLHPGHQRPVAVAWTSPVAGPLMVSGRITDAHPAGLDGVAFELAHIEARNLGPALADLGRASAPLREAGPPPDVQAYIRDQWREARADPAPVLAAIQAMQDQLFEARYGQNAALAVGNGFPAWEERRRIVAAERVQGAAREPLFRMVALPAQPDTYVIWDRLRLEGGDGPPLVFAEHPQWASIIEQASGLKFGFHPQGHPVPLSALVTEAGAEILIDLSQLAEQLQAELTLPRFLRADVRLDEASPESAAVQAFLIAATGGGGNLAEPVATAAVGDPRAALIVHPRVAAERERPAARFRALFPPAVLFQPIIPRDAQGSVFLYRREDEPLRRLLLDDAGRAEIDRLWSELEFVSQQALATPIAYQSLVQYYRKPNDGARIMFFYIQEFEEQIRREEQDFRAAQVAAEPRHLEALLDFAARAWRRPLTADERVAIMAAYQADRDEGAQHDSAFRSALARVLASPWFLYRVEQPTAGSRWQPVSGLELATRLSFLVWDSLPDAELRAAAEQLHDPGVLETQLRRLLQDERAVGMAAEFGARWLGVRDFVDNHGRNLQYFPEFTPTVREALADEPVWYFADQLRHDRPVREVIDSDAIVINDVLAQHYGIPGIDGAHWRRVEQVGGYGRGGLLGFGAVIAKHSAAARTSPIKRGAWLVQLLGERLPPVPPDVPPLPETPPAGLSVRQITERHRADPQCAGCHQRIDPFGMALEGFDALGRLRPIGELQPGDTVGTLADGTQIEGLVGLRDYFVGPRRADFFRNLAQKLVGYALGRAVMTSDRSLVDEVAGTMTRGGRWSDALLVIVRSDQFRCIRSIAADAEPTE
jgi:hypothetical protein